MCWVIFSYTNLMYRFLRAYREISAHNDVPNMFSILICLFALNWNPALFYASKTETTNGASILVSLHSIQKDMEIYSNLFKFCITSLDPWWEGVN